MQIIFESKEKSILKIERNEECLSVLKSFAESKDSSFVFSIIGACSMVELSYYDLNKRKYFGKEFKKENIEILSIDGNVAWSENEAIVHAHGVFSNENYETFGGHITKLVISVTGEVVINWLPEKINKKYDEETGLKLLSV